MEQEDKIVIFQENKIRRVWHENDWWFVIEDVIAVLTDSKNPKKYLTNLRQRDKELAKGYAQIGHILPVNTSGGTQRMTCANTEGLFRIIMAVPSPKAEPFKLWLAKVGKERIDEIENPELAAERAQELYRQKGYSEEWIKTRLKSIEIRQQLTDEWQQRGVQKENEYSILTAEISKATFGMTPSEYKKFKELESGNLRDHMTNLELIFTMLGEESTRRIAIIDDAKGFNDNFNAAQRGGSIAGKSRENYEKETNEQVSTPQNFLNQLKSAEESMESKKEKTPPIDE